MLASVAACGDDLVEVDNTCVQVSSTGQVYDPGTPGQDGAPEIPTGFVVKTAVRARTFMVVAANPLATKAGCDILSKGGSAVDAAVAVQLVLSMVEPQSSGIGGGAFLLHYDARSKAVTAYDGRETAPAAATENYLRWISEVDQTAPLPSARASGRSIGTPSALNMLDLAQQDHGKLDWKTLFEPALRIASDGFKISPRMAASIAASASGLARDPEARAYFLNPDGTGKASGTLLTTPGMVATLEAVAANRSAGFYSGPVAQDIVDEIADTTGAVTPGLTTLADLAAYRAKKREPICTTYRDWQVCGMPPPSSGGLAIAQILGVLENFDLEPYRPTAVDSNGGEPTVMGVHLVTEAERLAYADRDKYVADTDFVPLPGGSPATLVDKNYLKARASLISTTKSMGIAAAGSFSGGAFGVHGPSNESGTTHVSIVDGEGNVVTMTTTVESAFGSFHMTRGGFLLNNQLTDFSANPTDAAGTPIANRIAAGKRPRSSMAPTLLFRQSGAERGDFFMATGSPGGATIIQYVAKTLVGVLDWNLDAQQSASLVDFGASNTPATNVGGEHPNIDSSVGGANDPLILGLSALGHQVNSAAQSSGVSTILVRTESDGTRVYEGGADPRREGIVLGDLIAQ